MHGSTEKQLTAVDGRNIATLVKVQFNSILKATADPCRFRYVEAYIASREDIIAVPDVLGLGELVFGNPFLVRSGLSATDFLAENEIYLSSIDCEHISNHSDVGKYPRVNWKIS